MTRHIDEEVRPYWDEHAQPVGVVQPRSHPLEPAGTIEQKWEQRILAGVCPRIACGFELDDEDCCARCGWSFVEYRMQQRLATPEQHDDYITTLPGALWVDEYAPADLG